jgi:H+-translocating NAD(P) transhydrogenase subunit beta
VNELALRTASLLAQAAPDAAAAPMSMNFSYLVAAICFILTLQELSSPKHARRGNTIGAIGMTIAVVATFFLHPEIRAYNWILIAFVIGAGIGAAMSAWIPMTKMPERIALSHSFGGLAVALVGISHYHHHGGDLGKVTMTAVGFEVFFGMLTFTGSLMAFGKLQGFITGSPIAYKGQNLSNIALFATSLAMVLYLIVEPTQQPVFYAMGGIGLLLGVLFVLPIGGADMPVVVSLLNSYAGLAMAATGFALNNNILIIAGALDGTSGFLLSLKMSKAMNRSFSNVLFGAFGGEATAAAGGKAEDVYGGKIKATTPEEIAMVLDGARRVIFVPGYGLAVSQAQHTIRDLANLLKAKGCDVKYAIHPVAGRMPGHMNVLLAEADIPYDELLDMDTVNPLFGETDVAIIIGANDVVNPEARLNPKSPIAGMPILDADKARTVIVIKRSLSPGFAGIPNPLFAAPNALMFFADGKKAVMDIISAVKAA